jgi:hypothetical protein
MRRGNETTCQQTPDAPFFDPVRSDIDGRSKDLRYNLTDVAQDLVLQSASRAVTEKLFEESPPGDSGNVLPYYTTRRRL